VHLLIQFHWRDNMGRTGAELAVLPCQGCPGRVVPELSNALDGQMVLGGEMPPGEGPWKKKKKILHHSSHIRLIRWTLPVSRDIGEHNEQAESTSVCSVQVGHRPGVRVTSSGHSAKQPPGRAQVESSKITTPAYEGESTVWSN